MITPEEFIKQAKEIKEQYEKDHEALHSKMDDLMCNTLRELGFGEGIDIFEDCEIWYS